MTAAPTTQRGPARMRIGGELVEATGGETLEVLNPATGEVLTTTPAGGPADVDRAVGAARVAFEDGPWPRMEPSERAKLLHRFADRLEKRMEDLFRLETLNNGRPVRESARRSDGLGNGSATAPRCCWPTAPMWFRCRAPTSTTCCAFRSGCAAC